MLPRLNARVGGPGRPTVLVVRVVAVPMVIIAGCLVAGGVLVLFGVIGSREYVPYFYGSLQIALIVGTAACVTVIAYETLRSQLEATSLELRTRQLDEERARKLALEAQLASLESRVQPHFLFNTLNSIAALVHDDPAGAERMTNQLASLMRSSLDTVSTPMIPLDEELRVVRDYLQIERVRFGDRLRFTLDALRGAGTALVPRRSCKTLVEE